MFTKIDFTKHPPLHKPLMVWDGQCEFCAYWVSRWQKLSGDTIDYATYQETAAKFKDINKRHFMTASRLIEPSGEVFSGPRSAYRTFTYGKSFWSFLDHWYANKPWFSRLSDYIYQQVAKHRGGMYKLTVALFGRNPNDQRPFWAIYLAIVLYFIYIFA